MNPHSKKYKYWNLSMNLRSQRDIKMVQFTWKQYHVRKCPLNQGHDRVSSKLVLWWRMGEAFFRWVLSSVYHVCRTPTPHLLTLVGLQLSDGTHERFQGLVTFVLFFKVIKDIGFLAVSLWNTAKSTRSANMIILYDKARIHNFDLGLCNRMQFWLNCLPSTTVSSFQWYDSINGCFISSHWYLE